MQLNSTNMLIYTARHFLSDDLASDLHKVFTYRCIRNMYMSIYHRSPLYPVLSGAVWKSTSSLRIKIRGSEPREQVRTAQRGVGIPRGGQCVRRPGLRFGWLLLFPALSQDNPARLKHFWCSSTFRACASNAQEPSVNQQWHLCQDGMCSGQKIFLSSERRAPCWRCSCWSHGGIGHPRKRSAAEEGLF